MDHSTDTRPGTEGDARDGIDSLMTRIDAAENAMPSIRDVQSDLLDVVEQLAAHLAGCSEATAEDREGCASLVAQLSTTGGAR